MLCNAGKRPVKPVVTAFVSLTVKTLASCMCVVPSVASDACADVAEDEMEEGETPMAEDTEAEGGDEGTYEGVQLRAHRVLLCYEVYPAVLALRMSHGRSGNGACQS